jgi:hypothetical protein
VLNGCRPGAAHQVGRAKHFAGLVVGIDEYVIGVRHFANLSSGALELARCGNLDLQNIDPRRPGADQAFGVGVGTRQQKQGAAPGSAEGARDCRPAVDVDAVGDEATVEDALKLMSQGHRRPYPAFGVHGETVGRSVQTVGEHPPLLRVPSWTIVKALSRRPVDSATMSVR